MVIHESWVLAVSCLRFWPQPQSQILLPPGTPLPHVVFNQGPRECSQESVSCSWLPSEASLASHAAQLRALEGQEHPDKEETLTLQSPFFLC